MPEPTTTTVGKLAADLRTNGPTTIRVGGRTYKANAWTTINRDGPTWQQIEAARDCACPTCRHPRTGGPHAHA